jgi:hypothetical protein
MFLKKELSQNSDKEVKVLTKSEYYGKEIVDFETKWWVEKIKQFILFVTINI